MLTENDTNQQETGQKLRQVEKGQRSLTAFSCEEIGSEPVAWLEARLQAGMLLLAHAEDGIIWGKVKIDEEQKVKLVLADQQASLRKMTLTMARLFDTHQEIFLWQVGEDRWAARMIRDGEGEATYYYDEKQILWGLQVEAETEDFRILTEGAQGLRHSPPTELWCAEAGSHKAYLPVRHYLQASDDALPVVMSRLMKPQIVEAIK